MSTATNFANRSLGTLLLALSLSLAVTAAPALAQEADSSEQVAFGIRPVTANPLIPESYSYFVHTIDSGSTLTDEVMVLNEGTVPVRLDLYVADATTAINGGTAFANTGITSTEAASWITVNADRVSLQPGEQEIVPFTIDVPSEASPGQYIAGIVVQPEPTEVEATEEEGTQFGVKVVHRAGIAVVIEVPGPSEVALSISDLKIRELNDEGTLFSYAVVNIGTVMLRGFGMFTITNPDGDEVAVIAFEMGTVLPGDIGLFLIPYSESLGDGDYQLWVTLDYQPVLAQHAAKTTALGPIDTSIIGGQPAEASGVYPEVQPGTSDPLPISDEGSSSTSAVLRAAAVAVVVLIGAIALLVRYWYPSRRRLSARKSGRRPASRQRRARQPRDPAPPNDLPEMLDTVPDPFPPNELYDDEPAVNDGDPWSGTWTPVTRPPRQS